MSDSTVNATAGGLVCPKCGGRNVQVHMVQTKAKTRGRGMGCLWGTMRVFLIICTLGLWLLVGARKGTGKTRFTNERVAVCQTCGNSWSRGKH